MDSFYEPCPLCPPPHGILAPNTREDLPLSTLMKEGFQEERQPEQCS